MNVKSDIKYIYELYKQSIDTQKFMMIFLLSIVLSIYSIFAIAFQNNYIMGFNNIYTNGLYLACLLLIVLVNTINIYSMFENNSYLIIRLKTKKEYINKLVKTICVCNIFTIFINVILVLILLNLFCHNDLSVTLKNYSFPGWIYLIYMIIRFIIISSIISTINVYLLKIVNNKILIALNIILYIFIAGTTVYINYVISSITQIPLFIGSYLVYQLYSSFIMEICCFILYSMFLYLISVILKKICLNNMRRVNKL